MGFWRRLAGIEQLEALGAIETRSESAGGVTVPPSRSAVGGPVRLETALGLSGVFRAVQILTTAVGQLELGNYGRRGREETLPTIVEQPDVDRSQRSFIARTVVNLAGPGEAFWRVFRDPSGRPSVVRSLNPLNMYVGRDGNGFRTFDYHDEWAPDLRNMRPYRRGSGEIIHLRLLEVPGMDNGLGPIQACRLSLRGALDLRDYAAEWFSGGDVPTGVLSTNQQLTPDDADRYRERWDETQAGRRGLAVLGQGLEYAPVLLKPADAQFLETQQFSVTEQARMFGIPAAYLLAEINGNAMTYENMQDADIAFLKYTIRQYLDVIEDAFSMLVPIGEKVRFKTWGFLQSDNKTRAEVNEIYIRNRVKSPETVAAEEGLPDPPAEAPAVDQGGRAANV